MRRALQFALAVVAVVVLATPASAGSAWDPNDTTGPLDIRWLGAKFTAAGNTSRLTISFYDSFRTSALPTMVRRGYYPTFRGRGALSIILTDYYVGFVAHRHDGRLIFVYADWGSDCCDIARVRTPSAHVLRVTFPTIRDPADPTYGVRAESTWKLHGDVFRDRTRTIHLGLPPGHEP
jgi:hypothetical protein